MEDYRPRPSSLLRSAGSVALANRCDACGIELAMHFDPIPPPPSAFDHPGGMKAMGEGLRSFLRFVPRLSLFAPSCAFRAFARDTTSWIPACAGMTSSGFTHSCVIELIHGVNTNRPRHTDLACRNSRCSVRPTSYEGARRWLSGARNH